MKIEVGDTIRLKSSLKVGKKYDSITFRAEMDYRPNRVVVSIVDGNTVRATGLNGYEYWYPFSMLDIRTLRKSKEEEK